MRRILFTTLASAALLIAVPATALASHHHRHRGHHGARHQVRTRVERFGPVSGESTRGGGDGNSGDGTTVGTVDSFSGGRLAIKLNDGSIVSGAVTGESELRCEPAQSSQMQTDDRGDGGDNGGDDQGGDDQGGDDQGGDDQGGQACSTITPGMTVRSAELSITSAGAVWREVELISQP